MTVQPILRSKTDNDPPLGRQRDDEPNQTVRLLPVYQTHLRNMDCVGRAKRRRRFSYITRWLLTPLAKQVRAVNPERRRRFALPTQSITNDPIH